MKARVYIETTVPSYYVARPSRDVIALAHQEITRMWWETSLPHFSGYVSPVVLDEAGRGDPVQAENRLKVLAGFEMLEANAEVERLTLQYIHDLDLPPKATRDAAHLAFACAYELDYLVTWNCMHIANAEVVRLLASINSIAGLATPIICTPEELMGREENSYV